MKDSTSLVEIREFLEAHKPIENGAKYEAGECIGAWRIVAFVGKGGNGEVYRVQNIKTGDFAALKIASLTEEVARNRIEREADFLGKNIYSFFPHFFERGMHEGCLYFVMELLEPIDLPGTDKDVADLMIKLGDAVSALHAYGFVHRDIKPSNIMKRVLNGNKEEYVLIDLGLLKWHNVSCLSNEKSTVTVVDGKVATSGTRHYSAPEQFYGDELTPAADIHALGVIVQECFAGHLPKAWEKIVLRATSSVADRRYQTVREFVRDVKRRKCGRNFAILSCGLLALIGCAIVTAGLSSHPKRVAFNTSKAILPIITFDKALGVSGYQWQTSSDPWTICGGDNFDGGYAVQSSGGGAGIAETFIKTKVDGKAKEMTVKFQLYYYNGEFSIEIDDDRVFFDKSISRDSHDKWRIAKVQIPEGEHNITLKYKHSGAGYVYRFNGVRIDTIEFVDM